MGAAWFTLAGVALTGGFGLILDSRRRRDERLARATARTEQREDDTRTRREAVYAVAMARLIAAQTALHRAHHVLYVEVHAGGDTPFSLRDSIAWAVEEAEALRRAQPDVELFATDVVATEYGHALQVAARLRHALGHIGDASEWDESWATKQLDLFGQHYEVARRQMREDLAHQV